VALRCFAVYLTNKDFTRLNELAKSLDRPLGEVARYALRRFLENPIPIIPKEKPSEDEDIREMIFRLRAKSKGNGGD